MRLVDKSTKSEQSKTGSVNNKYKKGQNPQIS